jgi:hypothetical protein
VPASGNSRTQTNPKILFINSSTPVNLVLIRAYPR